MQHDAAVELLASMPMFRGLGGELLTAIIYPSHELADGYAKEVVSVDGESNMYIYNRHMTVQELIDLVTFLQPEYDVIVPPISYRGHR